jgi:hypothetical protein
MIIVAVIKWLLMILGHAVVLLRLVGIIEWDWLWVLFPLVLSGCFSNIGSS